MEKVPSPQELLENLRETDHPANASFLKQFQFMPVDDKLELLFYLTLESGNALMKVEQFLEIDRANS
tara:strand:- start:1545 stop:1745 length:201 start_codon:yes stop_codon:yes gene_type:complete